MTFGKPNRLSMKAETEKYKRSRTTTGTMWVQADFRSKEPFSIYTENCLGYFLSSPKITSLS
jgi:hypothetical protein